MAWVSGYPLETNATKRPLGESENASPFVATFSAAASETVRRDRTSALRSRPSGEMSNTIRRIDAQIASFRPEAPLGTDAIVRLLEPSTARITINLLRPPPEPFVLSNCGLM